MKHLLCLTMLLMATLAGATGRWDFEKDSVGKLPFGWTEDKTGEGPGSVWRIAQDSGTQVLAQTSSDGPNRFFNLCTIDDSSYQDLELSVSLKAISGKNDRGGGLVWRYRDAKNYYIARWNPLESNFRVYKVIDGKRIQFDTVENIVLPQDRWHTIKIIHAGNKIRCFLDDKEYLKAEDSTFPGAGKIGLWSKSDAVTYFDNLSVRELK